MSCLGRSTFGLDFTVLSSRRYRIMSQKTDILGIHSFFSFRNTAFCCAKGTLFFLLKTELKDEKILEPGSPSFIL